MKDDKTETDVVENSKEDLAELTETDVVESSSNIVKTRQLIEVERMVAHMLKEPKNRIGLVLGEPGSGKTEISKHLANEFDGVRLCCDADWVIRDLLLELALALGYDGNENAMVTVLKRFVKKSCADNLLILDEANHLSRAQLESVRILSDEYGASIMLMGTQVLGNRFDDPKNRVYLAQLNTRIGVKRVVLSHIQKPDEVAAFLVEPLLGIKVTQKPILNAFQKACAGNWRQADQLSNAIRMLMEKDGITELSVDLVKKAGAFLTQRRDLRLEV